MTLRSLYYPEINLSLLLWKDMEMGKIITGITALVLLVAFGLYAGYRSYEAYQKNQKMQAGKKVRNVVVNMAEPERKNMTDERRFSGTSVAWSDFTVDPKVDGRLMRLHFDIGDTVKRGDLIAEIDDREFRQQVQEAEANLDYAKAKLWEASEVSKLKKSEFERRKTLIDLSAVSRSDFEQAESEMLSQLATEAMCRADVKRSEAVLENAKLKLSYTRIHAQWHGADKARHIGKRFVDEGALLKVGSTSLLTIVELDRIKANVQIIERDYPYLRVGQKADIETDAYPGEVFSGEISHINNTLDEKTRSATAIISIDNKDLRLRPGMFLRVRIKLSEHKNALTVPLSALVQKDDKTIVFQYVDGKAVQTEVQTGLTDGKSVEILSPELKYPVATVGNQLLNDGMAVEISELSRQEMAEKKLKDGKAKAQPAPENKK